MKVNEIEIFYIENIVNINASNVIIVHGLAEHCQRYNEVAEKLNTNNFNVFRYDLRGHGLSEGKKGALKSFMQMIDDLEKIIEHVKSKYSGKIFLLGHSMGGLIVNLYAALKPKNISGIISSGAATKYVKAVKPFIYFPRYLINWIYLKAINFDVLAHDKNVCLSAQNDKLNLKKIQISLVSNMLIKGVYTLQKSIKNIDVPIIYLHGRDDKLVPCEFSEYMFNNISSKDKDIKILEKSKHEILFDFEKDLTLKYVLDFLKSHE